MLEIIKSVRICDKYNLSLIRFQSTKCYEIQYSDDERILEYEDGYTNKKDGLIAFDEYLKSLIKKVQ